MTTVLLVSALLVGSLLAVQASANLQLNKAVGTPYGASTLQLWLAAVLLTVLAVATGQVGALAHVLDVPAWFLFGGLASPLYITSGILLFPRVGALAAAGLFVTGQTLASIVLDVFGLLGLEQRPVSVGILAGSTAVIAGITVIIRGQRPVAAASSPAPASVGGTAGVGAIATPPMTPAVGLPPAGAPSRGGAGSPGWVGLGLLAGAALPIQGAINARLRAELEQPIAVGLVSFVVAAWAISTVLAALLLARRTSRPRLAPLRGMPWWGWLGGGVRGLLRHRHVPAPAGHRRRRDGRADGHRTAAGVRGDRLPGPVPAAAATVHPDPDDRPGASHRRFAAGAASLTTSQEIRPRACSRARP